MRGELDRWLFIFEQVVLSARLFAICGRLVVSVCGCKRETITFILFTGLVYNFKLYLNFPG